MIIPGILQQNLNDIRRDLETVKSFARLVQIDFADGKLVEGKTFLDLNKILETDTPTKYDIHPKHNIHTKYDIHPKYDIRPKYDIHLMVEDPFPYLENTSTNIVQISAQAEAPIDLEKWLNDAKKKGYKVGLSLTPNTPWQKIEQLISSMDFIQFLTVVPGKQGNPFQPKVLQNIREFRQKHPKITIQVDGGITETNIERVLNAGANNVVIGSAILRAENPLEAYKNFERILKTYGK